MKQLIENWRGFLNEGVTDIVYHYTFTENLSEILRTNKFSTSIGFLPNEWEHSKGKHYYYFSTARTPFSDYVRRRTKDNKSVLIVLNGRKLGQTYRSMPVNYLASSGASRYEKSEAEDRVLTNKPYIKDASSFILSVHFGPYMDEGALTSFSNKDYEDLKDSVEILNERQIPVFIYTRYKDWKNLNNKEALRSLSEFDSILEKEGWHEYQSKLDSSGLPKAAVQTFGKKPEEKIEELESIFEAINLILEGEDLGGLDETARSFVYRILDPDDSHATHSSSRLNAKIKTLGQEGQGKEIIDKYVKLMRSLDEPSINTLMEKVKQTYNRTYVYPEEEPQAMEEHFNNWREFIKNS